MLDQRQVRCWRSALEDFAKFEAFALPVLTGDRWAVDYACSFFARIPLRIESTAGTSSFSVATSSGLWTSAVTFCFTFLISCLCVPKTLSDLMR
jgi:hypothetical protein